MEPIAQCRRGWGWVAGILILGGACRAEADEPRVIDPITVTARGHATPLSKTPGSVGIVGERDISERQAASVPNLFQLVPGVLKTSDSEWSSDVNIRGMSHDSVTLLIDGCRVNTATDINARYGLIDPMEIERIEILKGPISSLYGAGAMGGVVNIITRTGHFAAEPSWGGGVSVYGLSNPGGISSFGYADMNSPDWYAYGSQGYRKFGSYEDGDGNEMRNSQFQDQESAVKFGRKFNNLHRVEAQVQFYEGDEIGIPGTGTAPLPANADVTYPRVSRVLGSAVYTLTPQNSLLTQSQLTLYYQEIDRRVRIDNFTPPSPVVVIRPQADHQTFGGRWLNQLVTGDHTVVAGADVWQRQLTSTRTREMLNGTVQTDTPLPDSDFTSAGAFVEDSWDVFEHCTMNGGARIDSMAAHNETTENWEERRVDQTGWSAHLGGTMGLTDALNTRVIVARGYRPASLEERYQYIVLGSGVTKWGNPNLDPEESTFAEWGLNWLGARLSAGASVFYNALDNLIAEVRTSPTRIDAQNVRKAEINGAEAEARWYVTGSIQLYGNVAYVRGKDDNTHEDLPDIPPLSGMAGLRYDPHSGFWGYVETTAAAAQQDTPPGVEPSHAWQVVDVRLGYDLASNRVSQRFYVGVNNAFDRSYHEYLSTSRGFTFNEPGRCIVGGYSAKF